MMKIGYSPAMTALDKDWSLAFPFQVFAGEQQKLNWLGVYVNETRDLPRV